MVSARSAVVLDAFVREHPGSTSLPLDATDRAAVQQAAPAQDTASFYKGRALDLIVGFPGETEDDFQELLGFLEAAQLDRVGAFAYSPVEGATANDKRYASYNPRTQQFGGVHTAYVSTDPFARYCSWI